MKRAGKRLVGQAADPIDDALVFRFARGAQLGEITKQDGVQRGRRVALAGEALHPDAVGDQQMVERAHHRFEEGAGIAPELFLVE